MNRIEGYSANEGRLSLLPDVLVGMVAAIGAAVFAQPAIQGMVDQLPEITREMLDSPPINWVAVGVVGLAGAAGTRIVRSALAQR